MATEAPGPSAWERHLAAAQAMGLSQREALETWEDGWPGRVRASRERREAMADMLDAREELERQRYPRGGGTHSR